MKLCRADGSEAGECDRAEGVSTLPPFAVKRGCSVRNSTTSGGNERYSTKTETTLRLTLRFEKPMIMGSAMTDDDDVKLISAISTFIDSAIDVVHKGQGKGPDFEKACRWSPPFKAEVRDFMQQFNLSPEWERLVIAAMARGLEIGVHVKVSAELAAKDWAKN